MVEQIEKSFNVVDVDDLAVRELGSASGIHVGCTITGVSMTSEDSDYKLVQSNDGTNWVDVTGATFTDLGNETLSVSLADAFTHLFIGFQMSSVGTETTGTIALNLVIK